MAQPAPGEITVLLDAVRDGNTGAQRQLVEHVYAKLHGLAAGMMHQERTGHTLQPTALVHEAFLRLFRTDLLRRAPNRAFLFAAAVRSMREVLADHARSRACLKRGGNQKSIPLDELVDHLQEQHQVDVPALHEALDRLAEFHERQSQVVTLRFFGGFTVEQVAEHLNVSVSTVESDFRIARAWLRNQLGDAAP